MTDQIILSLPDDVSEQVRRLAAERAQSVEDVVLDHLKTLALPSLPPDVQAELDALQRLSDDALWTIAREQMSGTVEARAHELMTKNTQGRLTDGESAELAAYVQRADRLMLRKAEAAHILRERGYEFGQGDFKSLDE